MGHAGQFDEMDEQRGLAVVDAQPPDRRRPAQIGMLRPLATAEQARAAIDEYEELKRAIVRDSDKQWFKQRVERNGRWEWEDRYFLKKSYWRRIATFFGVSLELAEERFLPGDEPDVFGYEVTYRAIAPNGVSVVSDGACWNTEKLTTDRETGKAKGRILSRHDTRATAHTRAKNRAISDLVAGGEVSAEEINDREPEDAVVPATQVQRNRIANACKHLGRAVPEIHGYDHAETVLAALTQEYRDLQQRQTVGQQKAQAQQAAAVVDESTPMTFVEEQPAAATTTDLADLPMARGGRH